MLSLRCCKRLSDTAVLAIAANCPLLREIDVGEVDISDAASEALAASCALLQELNVFACVRLTEVLDGGKPRTSRGNEVSAWRHWNCLSKSDGITAATWMPPAVPVLFALSVEAHSIVGMGAAPSPRRCYRDNMMNVLADWLRG